MDATTISIRKETKERLQKLGNKGETYDAIISRLIQQLFMGRPFYSVDIRLALTPNDSPPDYYLLVDSVVPVTNTGGTQTQLLIKGTYLFQNKEEVENRLVWLQGLKRTPDVNATILRNGYDKVAHLTPVTVHEGSVRRGGSGYHLTLLVYKGNRLILDGLDASITEKEWRQQYLD